MGYNRAAHASLPAERRAAGRARTDCPARLQTPGGEWHGRLWDLSEGGARVHVDHPPAQGAVALIKWQSHEMFCRVMWSADDMCGVVFEKPIPYSVVLETLGEEPVETQGAPPASLGNIPAGKRRSWPRRDEDS